MTAPLCVNPRCRKPLRKRKDRLGYAHVDGRCMGCYHRWHRAGFAGSGPPDAMPPAQIASCGGAVTSSRNREERIDRVLAFARLRARGFPLEVAARRVGVAVGTARAYEAELRRNASVAA